MKKSLATLMAVCMVIGITACGQEPASSSSSIGTQESEETESYVESSVEESSSEESIVESESSESAEESREGENEYGGISGLIIMTASNQPLPNGSLSGVCNLSSFDPESGETKLISQFQFKSSSDITYFWMDTMSSGYYQFDSTYSRMATKKYLTATGEEHAGWLTADGEFFDVTEAIGWDRQSDFDDPVRSISMGFTDSDLFIFSMEDPDDYTKTAYYSVPISDVTVDSVQECRVSACSEYIVENYSEYYTKLLWEYGKPTSWVDGTHCILTPKRGLPGNPIASVILDTESGAFTEYIPGDSRNNWNGHISPDGTRIAFTSVPKNGSEKPDIFIVSIDGGNPTRVAEHDFILAGADPDFGSGIATYADCTILLDWR